MATTTVKVFNLFQGGFNSCGGSLNGTFTGKDLNNDGMIDYDDGEVRKHSAGKPELMADIGHVHSVQGYPTYSMPKH